MCLGDNVVDQDFNWAEFAELSSSPPTMEASKALDAVGCLSGYSKTQSDATGAYTQAYLQGTPTWVRLPAERWPSSWQGRYKDPVVPLVLALYGHPDAGGHWERHCEKHVLSLGFQRVQSWDSVFWHPGHKAMLLVYVDDFKLAAPTRVHSKLWSQLRSRIEMEAPRGIDRFLGCMRRAFEVPARSVSTLLALHPGYHVRPKLGGAKRAPTPLQKRQRPQRHQRRACGKLRSVLLKGIWA